MRFDENGTVFQDKIRLLQYRRHSNGEEYYMMTVSVKMIENIMW